MTELTNIFARSIKDLTLISQLPSDLRVLDQVKIPVGNLPVGVNGCEALSFQQLRIVIASDLNKNITNLEQTVNSKISENQKLVDSKLLETKIAVNSKLLETKTAVDSSLAQNKSYTDQALLQLSTQATKFYPTLALANADISSLAVNQAVNIGEAENGGLWYKATADATSLMKSPYDPLEQVRNGELRYIGSSDSENLFEWKDKDGNIVLALNKKGQFVSYDEDTKRSILLTAQADIEDIQQYLDNLKLLNIEDVGELIEKVDSENLYEFKDADGAVVLRLAKNGLLRSAQIDDLMLLLEAFKDFKQALKQTEDSKLLRFEDAEKNLLGYVDKFNNWVLNGMNINAEINDLKLKKSGGAVNSGLKQIALKAPESLIQIYLTEVGNLPTAKGNTITGKAELHVDGQVFTAYINMEVQGSSSAAYAKKNWTFAFFSDRARTKSLDVKIGDLIPHDELVFKSNWIDHTNTRNVVAYKLWETMVATRKGYPKLEVEKGYIGKTGLDALQTGATGVPHLYPAVLYINDTFYGIGSFGIGKKRANYNIAKNKPTQIILGWEAWNDLQALETSDPVKYEFRAPSTPTNATYQAIADWNTFASLAVDSFKTEADKHLDKVNVIDFMLFVEFAYCDDLVRDNKVYNFLFISFDGKKFMFMPYDMDTIFGLHWSGGSISNDGTRSLLQNDLFWKKVIATYAPEMKSRYKELRDLGVFSVDSIYKMITNVSTTYPTSSQKDELEKWATKPSINITSAEQILGWISKRIQFLDTYFNYVA